MLSRCLLEKIDYIGGIHTRLGRMYSAGKFCGSSIVVGEIKPVGEINPIEEVNFF